ncbi:uncharacterized protein [Dysidea avara]|uniref:uncharacterized protein isoform X1 n=1 Tax=Dysidea avara TaxID=196820 RepID=UPI003325F371
MLDKMSDIWLTKAQSRSELDAASSVSLARSIYGSQAYFDGSTSSFQGSEVNLLQTRPQSAVHIQSGGRLNRPKSSPARALTERNKKSRPASAMVGSWSAHHLGNTRPSSAYPMRGRPSSALRPGSGVRRRPQSAAPWSTSTPLIEVEDFEDTSTRSTSRIKSANPVALNSIPEYIKVWEGKPLLPRDYGNKQFERKPWQRPKSDYGTHAYRRRRKSSKDAVTPIISVTTIDGSNDGNDDDGLGDGSRGDGHRTKHAWGDDDGDGRNRFLQDVDGGKDNGDDTGGRGGDDGKRNQSDLFTGGRRDNDDGSSRRNRGNADNSDLWASRLQPPQGDSDSDDDFFKKSEEAESSNTQLPSITNLTNERPESDDESDSNSRLPSQPTLKLPPVVAADVSKLPPLVAKGDTGRSVLIQLQQKPQDVQWMDYRMALARHSTRFELPMDMRKLETMTPERYLCTHCIVSDRRVQHYKRVFTAITKKTHPLQAAANCLHGFNELIPALIDAHYSSLSESEVRKVLEVVCLSPDQSVDFKLFSGVCALTERMYRDKFISSRSTGPAQEYGRYKEVVEDADFEALDWKLRGCTISKSLRNLFTQL